jgi:hypothetical protein
MVEAIEAQAALGQRRQDFVASALKAEQEVAEYGLVYSAGKVFSYILSKAEGKFAAKPKPRKR